MSDVFRIYKIALKISRYINITYNKRNDVNYRLYHVYVKRNFNIIFSRHCISCKYCVDKLYIISMYE